jgi:hypothetical protein
MFAMQYSINLPADYDMQIIRDRVASTGPNLDGFPGLRFKAFLMRERAHGAPKNEYAPFYVWNDPDGARQFLWGGGGFANLVSSFGRPTIRSWIVADVADGLAAGAPVWATRRIEPLPEATVLEQSIAEAVAKCRPLDASETIRTRVVAVDIADWKICEFALHVSRPDSGEGTTFQVLHVSEAAD